MKVIKYIQLYTYLTKEENHSPIKSVRIISYVRKLPVDFKSAIFAIIEHKIPDIEINGITLHELMEKDNMKPIRAIFMLDWIRREPRVAFRYMSRQRFSVPVILNDNEDKVPTQNKSDINIGE